MQRARKQPSPKHEQLPVVDWRDYIGFTAPLAQIAQLIASDTVPPVMLFSGREGLGKSAFALAVAALYSCQSGNACGCCDPCRLLSRGQEGNVLVLDGRQSLKVEDAAALQEHLSVKASRSQGSPRARRIGIIIDADQLTVQATNRLLKTLEEPPSGSSLILTTSRVKTLLPTLLSRCVRWHMQPPAASATIGLIEQRAASNPDMLTLSPEGLARLVERLALSPGRVLTYLQQAGQGGDAKRGEDLLPLLQATELSALLKEAEELCRQKSWTAQDIAREAEFALNLCYKQMLLSDRPNQGIAPKLLQKRRQFLRRLKQIAGKQKIALNAQLAAEHLGLFPYLGG